MGSDGSGHGFEVLELIRKAFNSSPTHGASNQAALAGLDLAAGATDRVRSDDQIADLCHAVRRRLTDAARRTGGLLFALDHLDSAAEEFRDTVGARLLAPIADGEVEGVRALVVCCDDEAHTRRWPYVGDLGSTFAVRGLPKHAWVPLATTLLYELGWEKRAADQARSWDWIVPDPWDAVALDALVIADKRMRKQAGR